MLFSSTLRCCASGLTAEQKASDEQFGNYSLGIATAGVPSASLKATESARACSYYWLDYPGISRTEPSHNYVIRDLNPV